MPWEQGDRLDEGFEWEILMGDLRGRTKVCTVLRSAEWDCGGMMGAGIGNEQIPESEDDNQRPMGWMRGSQLALLPRLWLTFPPSDCGA
jgi:hypothetical protein